MNIVVITELFLRGGLETQIEGFVRNVKAAGHRVSLVVGPVARIERLRDLVGDHVRMIDVRPDMSAGQAGDAVESIIGFSRNEQAHLLHVHPFLTLALGSLAAAKLGIPYVLTLHGPASLSSTYGVAFTFLLEHMVLPNASRIFCVSNEVMDLVREMAPDAHVRHLPNGVDLERFRHTERDPHGKWAVVARLDADKVAGIELFLDEFLGRSEWKCRVFGEGNARASLIHWLESKPYASRVKIEGHSDHLHETLQSGYAGVAGMGRVILEAAALGLPAILVGYDGPKGLVRRRQMDQLSERNFSGRGLAVIDADMLYEQMRDLAAFPHEYNLRPWVEENANEASIWQEYLAQLECVEKAPVAASDWQDRVLEITSRHPELPFFAPELLHKLLEGSDHARMGLRHYVLLADREQALRAELAEKEQALQAVTAQLVEKEQALQAVTAYWGAITSGTGWALLQLFWRVRFWVAPNGSVRDRVLRKATRGLRVLAKEGPAALARLAIERANRLAGSLGNQILARPGGFFDRYVTEDNSRVTLYSQDPSLFPRYQRRRALDEPTVERGRQVSLIASVKNEALTVQKWVISILNQTRLPDEIILVDGGSTDGTPELLSELARGSPVPMRVIVEPGANIARARNIAIRRARFPVIASTDFGAQPASDWLERLLTPFELQPNTVVSAGMWRPVDRRGALCRQRGWWLEPGKLDPQGFLPSSRSVAFRKDAWEAVGGYPEWLTLTGEDTYFCLELKRWGGEWAFVPEAMVEWYAPDTFASYLRKLWSWSSGDGESGVHAYLYRRYAARLCVAGIALVATLVAVLALLAAPVQGRFVWLGLVVAVWLSGLVTLVETTGLGVLGLFQRVIGHGAMVLGFLNGARRQREVARRRWQTIRGTWFVLSGVPIDDTGGGARCTQIALELLRQGYAVVFISRFPKHESRDLSLRFAHPNLLNYEEAEFSWRRFLLDYADLIREKRVCALVEFPLPDFLPLIDAIRERRGTIVYDLIDDWNTSLGSAWYSEAVERRVVASSDALVATVPSLVERLQRMSGRQVHLLPNAVNTHLFDPNKTYECPVDMPEASWVAIYIGALWGDWFDWELLVEVAARYPEAAVAAIGDYRGQCTDAPPNLHFLGLKSQQELPAYLSHADVAIIPWKDSPITKATSPLKVYEYIAMRRPVVAPHLAPLEGIPGVFLAKDRPDFLSKVEKARREPFPVGEVSEFLEENDWRTRVHQLIKVTEKACTRVADPMQRDHDFEQRLAEIVGEPIREVRINRIDFERFKADYRDGRAIDDEKRLEYYITCRWMDFKADDVFIDVAAQDCPLAFYVRDTYGCRVYRQDPYYIKPGINGEDIGGDAASLPLPDGSITKMALHNSFEHFEGDTDIRFIKEAQRVLRAGGKLCIVPLFIGDRYIQETDAGWLDDKGVKHLWGAGARFARCYDLDHFRKRILDNSMSFRVKIYRVVNFGELSSSGYLRYFAIFEKE